MKNKIYKDINRIRFFDGVTLFESIRDTPIQDKLRIILSNSGVGFYDYQKNFVKKPSVGIIGIGGLSFDFSKATKNIHIRNSNASLNIDEIKDIFSPMSAVGGYMSYLNSGNLDVQQMINVMTKYNHFSTLHMSYINLGIFGISSLVENEFNCQRDIMHLARITEARTSVQSDPPLTVLYPEYLPHFKKLLAVSRKERHNSEKLNKSKPSQKNHYEAANSLYPASKTTGLIVSITLKNLLKLVSMLADNGKEEEMKRVLTLINDTCHSLWPSFFKPTREYDYDLPKHW